MSLSPLQRAERLLVRALLRAPAPLLRPLRGAPLRHEGLQLDPQIQLVLSLQRRMKRPLALQLPLAQARRGLEADSQVLETDPPRLASVEALTLQTGKGPIAARIYRPQGLHNPAPALVFYHGGGFVLGSLDSHDVPCRILALEARCVVISVDYRLAPEHAFPAGIEDAIAAFRAVAAEAAVLGLDPKRLAVGGDSAGGNFAAVVAQQTLRDKLRPCFQLLIYPTTDFTMSFPSVYSLASGFLLEKRSMDWFRDQYLQDHSDLKAPLASPLYGKLEGLPPAFVMTAGFDPLRDEGEAYARKMQEAGVEVRLRRYDSLVHGFLNMSGGVKAARHAVRDAAQALRQGLG